MRSSGSGNAAAEASIAAVTKLARALKEDHAASDDLWQEAIDGHAQLCDARLTFESARTGTYRAHDSRNQTKLFIRGRLDRPADDRNNVQKSIWFQAERFDR
jgi:hypothetical protein